MGILGWVRATVFGKNDDQVIGMAGLDYFNRKWSDLSDLRGKTGKLPPALFFLLSIDVASGDLTSEPSGPALASEVTLTSHELPSSDTRRL